MVVVKWQVGGDGREEVGVSESDGREATSRRRQARCGVRKAVTIGHGRRKVGRVGGGRSGRWWAGGGRRKEGLWKMMSGGGNEQEAAS